MFCFNNQTWIPTDRPTLPGNQAGKGFWHDFSGQAQLTMAADEADAALHHQRDGFRRVLKQEEDHSYPHHVEEEQT